MNKLLENTLVGTEACPVSLSKLCGTELLSAFLWALVQVNSPGMDYARPPSFIKCILVPI
jgi:hypothetical protein